LVYPHKSADKVMVRSSLSRIPSPKKDMSVYDIVDWFRDEIFSKSGVKGFDEEIRDRVLLRDIVNLHNRDGIRDMSQIRSMIREITSGGDIFSGGGLPNIKLVETGEVPDEEILVFFGEHKTELNSRNWREHVINWQAAKGNQLQKRVQNDMGELLDSLTPLG